MTRQQVIVPPSDTENDESNEAAAVAKHTEKDATVSPTADNSGKDGADDSGEDGGADEAGFCILDGFIDDSVLDDEDVTRMRFTAASSAATARL